MTRRVLELVLGTVSFGLKYGIAGRTERVPDEEIVEILRAAATAGIESLDTAPGYGDIETRLASLCAGLAVHVISKIPAVPTGASLSQSARFVGESVERSVERLGPRLNAILFHRADDLSGRFGETLWQAAERAVSGRLRLGVSCYSPSEAVALRRRYPIALVQLPGNALDQRLTAEGVAVGLSGVEVHLRSVFLQGGLLMPLDDVRARIPASADAMTRWHCWCRAQRLGPLEGAIAVAKSLPSVNRYVLGLDRIGQLHEIVEAWRHTPPIAAPALASDSLDVIDPRRWPREA